MRASTGIHHNHTHLRVPCAIDPLGSSRPLQDPLAPRLPMRPPGSVEQLGVVRYGAAQ